MSFPTTQWSLKSLYLVPLHLSPASAVFLVPSLITSPNFNKQTSSVVRSGSYQLRVISNLKSLLSRSDFEILMHAFITSRLDYCNILYTGLTQFNIHKLQMVQNAAGRMLTGTKKREHITPVLAQLHWLPVEFRTDFKILLFVFKAVNGSAPPLYCWNTFPTFHLKVDPIIHKTAPICPPYTS